MRQRDIEVGEAGQAVRAGGSQGSMGIEPVFLFDLDGTLVDSVYQHVLAWKQALDAEGIELSVWRIHRKIGMSGARSTTTFSARRESKSALNASNGLARPRRRLPANDIRPLLGARELHLLRRIDEVGGRR